MGGAHVWLTRPLANRYRGHVGASLIVGGVDLNGPQLYGIHPHGSFSRLPFTALGERSLLLAHESQPYGLDLRFVLDDR